MKYEEQGRGIMADRFDFDLDAIDADDALLDLLAAGGESTRTAGEHDPAVALLAELRLAVEVEDELPVETIDDPESFLARCAALNPMTDPFARKVAARGLALGVAAVAALSVSGVAAAVTGDPLSPYEKVIEKVVDAVRPQTSFPKEQLDGMPVVDKTKIVKVAKDYKFKQDQKAEDAVKQGTKVTITTPPAVVDAKEQPDLLQRALPDELLTVKTLAPPVVAPTKLPEKTDDTKTSDNPTTQPPADTTTDQPTTQPTEPVETTAPPTTETPTSTPTDQPTDPNNGEQSDPGNPTTAPTGDGDTSSGETSTGDTKVDSTPPGSDTTSPTAPADTTGSDTSGDQSSTDPAGTVPSDPDQSQKPGGDTSQDSLTDVVKEILEPVLPTPSGAAAALESAQEFFGEGASSIGKHASGTVTTGSVKTTYPKGRHAAATPAEGKHAAIARAHGSTEDADVLTILGVVNTPTN